jgi:ribosome assembly protein 1
VTKYLQLHAATLKAILEEGTGGAKGDSDVESETGVEVEVEVAAVEAKGGGVDILSKAAFVEGLRGAFSATKDPAGVWTGVVDRLLSLGPKHIGPNLLIANDPALQARSSFWVERGSGSKGKEDAVDEALITGFQLATFAGPLCAEPVVGMAYFIEAFTQASQAEGEEESRSGNAGITGQIITLTKDACKQAFLKLSPRLMLAVYSCDIQASGRAPFLFGSRDASGMRF